MTSETSTAACNASPQRAGRQLDRPARGRRTWIAAVIMILAIVPGFWYFGFRGSEDPEAIWQAGEANLSAGRIDLAEAAAKRLSRLREPTPLDSMLRAQLDIANGRAEEAVAGLMRVPDGHPMAAQARLMAGQVELRRHRARFAEQYFRKALQLDPKLVQAHRELIYVLGHQLRRPELNAEFLALSRLTELTFDNVFHWCLMRTALWEPSAAPLRETAKNFELVNSLVQRAAIPKERENPKLLRDLGAACAAAGRDPEARGWYRLAIARDPLDVESQQALFQIENRDRSRNPTPIRDGESPRG